MQDKQNVLYFSYSHRDVEVITISSDSMDLKDKVLNFLKEKQASFKNYQFNVETTTIS
jgi:hypothetical protein